MDLHELYLGTESEKKKSSLYRLCLGELVQSNQRTVFPPKPESKYYQSPTGSIGFCDLLLGTAMVPATLFGHTAEVYHLKKTATVLEIGIEPAYQGQGYGTLLLQRAVQIAQQQQFAEVVLIAIDQKAKSCYEKSGFYFPPKSAWGIKRWNSGQE